MVESDPEQSKNPLLAAALSYAGRGWPVLPLHCPDDKGRCSCGQADCRAPAKHPRVPHGFKDATTDPGTIAEWWARCPSANVAIATGTASGLVVLDVDPRHGGEQSLEDLERQYGRLPETLSVETGGGGHHFYFRHFGPPIRTRVAVRPGLDLKGEGGFIVAPPSVHPTGLAYRTANATATLPALAPDWLLSLERNPSQGTDAAAFAVPGDPILEGHRNAALTSLAGSMRARGMARESIEAALLEENTGRCQPPLPESEVRGIAESVARYPAGLESSSGGSTPRPEGGKLPQATRLVALADHAALFHSPEGEAYITFEVGERRETAPVRSRAFRAWLVQRFFTIEKRAPAAQAVQNALATLEGLALHAAPCFPINVRIAAHGDAIYLDLANARGEAVEITAGGWCIVPVPPLKFYRPPGVATLPTPIRGGAVSELRPFVNVPTSDEADWRLMVAWLLAALRPVGPYPILILTGEAGAAKSTTARVLRSLVDPSRAPLRAEPRDLRDFMITATNSWMLALDNLSHLPLWLADALCRLATGGGLTTRKLYTDAEEQFFDARRPVILTSIEDLTARGDLLERALILSLPPIPEHDRRPESEMWREVDAAQPRLLGALLDAVAGAMARLPTTHVASVPRMADFALWGSAAESRLGWDPGAFLEAYDSNREAVNDLVLDSSTVVTPLLALAAGGSWIDTPTELLKQLTERVDEVTRQQKGWPKSPAILSGLLKRLAPNLRRAGLEVSFPRRTRKARSIRLEPIGMASSPSSRTSRSLLASAESPPAEEPGGDQVRGADGLAGDPQKQMASRLRDDERSQAQDP